MTGYCPRGCQPQIRQKMIPIKSLTTSETSNRPHVCLMPLYPLCERHENEDTIEVLDEA